MRALFCIGLCLAAPDFAEVRSRFLRDFARDAVAADRLKALRAVAECDLPQAAELLLNAWENLQGEVVALRRDLRLLRERIEDLDRRPPKDAAAQRQALHREDAKQSALLAQREREQAAVLDAFAGFKEPATIAWLADQGLRRAQEPLILHAIALRVAMSGGAGVSTLLVAVDRVRKPEEIVPLLHALAKRGKELGPGIPSILRHLQHKDWAVRAAAAHAIAASAQPEAVGALVASIALEKPDTRVMTEMARALQALTGEKLGPYPDLWARWWDANRARVFAGEVALGKGDATPAGEGRSGQYYGIPQDSTRIIYVLDVSGSMTVSMEDPKWVDNLPVEAGPGEESRYDAARRELLRAVRNLRRGTHFAVVLFSNEVKTLHTELVPADEKRANELEARLNELAAEGSTNAYAALDRAIRLAGASSEGTRTELRADEIFFVSDGAPTDAAGQVEDYNRVLQAVRQWNAMKRVVIHTIGIGKEHNVRFMKQLASENGGQYRGVQPKKG